MEIKFNFRARAVIISNNSLLATRIKGMDYTFLPGGHVEAGESITTALTRELKEELGKDAKIGKYLGAIEQSWTETGKGRQYEINHLFACDIPDLTSDSPVTGLEEEYEFFWLKPEDFNTSKLLPKSARELLKNYIAGDTSALWASDWLD